MLTLRCHGDVAAVAAAGGAGDVVDGADGVICS